MQGKFYITRQVEFSAAHRLYREELSESENRELFGPCANPFGHGHNYLLEVTFVGERNPVTGMVVHFQTIKRLLQETVIAPLDHRHMNHDVEMLKGVLPTSENLLAVLWESISRTISSQSFQLHSLKLHSTSKNFVEFFGPSKS